MSDFSKWLERVNRLIFPVVVVGIILYGTWDLLIRDSIQLPQPTANCDTTILDVAVFEPSVLPNQTPRRVQTPANLAIIVPAGEKRILSVSVVNPDDKGVVHQWTAVYGQFDSRITVDSDVTYTAPQSLVNDTLTLEATRQGCTAARRTLEMAVIPAANAPLPPPLEPTPTLPPDGAAPSMMPNVPGDRP